MGNDSRVAKVGCRGPVPGFAGREDMDEKQDGNSFPGLMPLLFSFKGRINRATFWSVGIALNIISYLINKVPVHEIEGVLVFIWFSFLLIYIYSYLAISIKRLHDRNKSGWW